MDATNFNPQTLLMDFYAVAGVRFELIDTEDASFVFAQDAQTLGCVVCDPDLAGAATAIRAAVVQAMKRALVRDGLFILAAEVRHIYDKGKLSPSRSGFFTKNFGPVGRKWFFIYDAIYSHAGAGLDCEPVTPAPPLDTQFPGYLQSYVAGATASRETGLPFHEVAERVFDRTAGAKWSGSFGGKAWLEIARAYRELLTAETETEIIVAADRLISLEHNTNTLFTKCSHWAVGGDWAWIKGCLDIKFSASSPVAFLGLCSEGVRQIVLGLHLSGRTIGSPGGPLRGAQEDAPLPRHPEPPESGSPEAGGAFLLDSVGEGDMLGLQYEGAVRQFQVEAVHVLGYGHRSFILSPSGWHEHKGLGPGGKPLVIELFAMTGEEVQARFVSRQEVEAVERVKRVAARFAAELHQLLGGIVALEKPLLAVGSVQLGEYVFRFRIKGPEGRNFRVYVGASEKSLCIFTGTSRHPAEDPFSEDVFEEFTLDRAEDGDFLADFGRRLLGAAVASLAAGDD